ncbi:MAG: hypothetical protein QM820_18240 [Minicystis sp.]
MARVFAAFLDAIVVFVAIAVSAYASAASTSGSGPLSAVAVSLLGLIVFRAACARVVDGSEPRRLPCILVASISVMGFLLVLLGLQLLRAARSAEPRGFAWMDPFALPVLVADFPVTLGVFAASIALRCTPRSVPLYRIHLGRCRRGCAPRGPGARARRMVRHHHGPQPHVMLVTLTASRASSTPTTGGDQL